LKQLLKSIVRGIAVVLVSPLLLSHVLLGALTTTDASLETHSQLLSLLPGTVGSYLRVAFYRFALKHCDPTATIGFGVLFSKSDAEIHSHVYIGPRCMIGLVTLERDVLLGPGVQIPSGPQIHGIDRLDIPIRNQPGTPKRVSIGHDSWIGGGCVILADVAPQCVIGAGSVVTKPTNPQTIVAGVPASELRSRNSS
jgi:acetyltransferase-like isoleucine patch superfamily enzyme